MVSPASSSRTLRRPRCLRAARPPGWRPWRCPGRCARRRRTRGCCSSPQLKTCACRSVVPSRVSCAVWLCRLASVGWGAACAASARRRHAGGGQDGRGRSAEAGQQAAAADGTTASLVGGAGGLSGHRSLLGFPSLVRPKEIYAAGGFSVPALPAFLIPVRIHATPRSPLVTRGTGRCGGLLESGVDQLHDLGLGPQANGGLHGLAVLEDRQHRDRHHAVVTGGVRVLVDV